MSWAKYSQFGSRVLRKLLPSGIGRVVQRMHLRRRYGLTSLGMEFDYHISDDTAFGTGCRLGGPVYIAGSSVGDYTYIEVGCRISAVTIGRFCSIAPYTLLGLAEHPTNFTSTHPMFYRRLPEFGYDLVAEDTHTEVTRTTVGNDVWIGAGACIKGGVTIGDGAIIGAGAVVTSSVEPYAIYAGVPARIIRYRFDAETIARLLEVRWWERGKPWLKEHLGELQDMANV